MRHCTLARRNFWIEKQPECSPVAIVTEAQNSDQFSIRQCSYTNHVGSARA